MCCILVVCNLTNVAQVWSQKFETRKMAEACAKFLSFKDKDCGGGILSIEIYDENREEVIAYKGGSAYKVEDNGRWNKVGASAG